MFKKGMEIPEYEKKTFLNLKKNTKKNCFFKY